jgi:hypothetical protein
METVVVPATSILPVTPDEAVALERRELEQFIAALIEVPPESWFDPAGDHGKDLRALVAHVAGGYAAQASFAELRRQAHPKMLRLYRMEGDSLAMTVTRIQIGDRRHRPPEELIAELREVGPIAIDHRARLFSPLQALMRVLPARPGLPRVPLGPFQAVRDLWYHRLDLAEMTGAGFTLNSEHDGRILELLVRAAAASANRVLGEASVDLKITTAAGGVWRFGDHPRPDAAIEMDPVAFAKQLGRRRSPAATRERSHIEGDVKTAMMLLSALHRAG